MQVFDKLTDFKSHYSSCVATIGKYDGMHLGHQRILSSVLEQAQELGLPAVAILSEPQPEEFFMGDKAPVRLSHFNDKVSFLESFGFDAVYRMNFDESLSQLSSQEFISQILIDGLRIKGLTVGDDFRFGKNREGDFSLLQEMGPELGFSVAAESACCLEEERVSSTLVREELLKGDCERVKRLLGRYYSISGEVVLGKQLGRQIGTPTANISISALPLKGVFAVEALLSDSKLGDTKIAGVANIGYKPTVTSDLKPSLEVHLFDFEQDIYGESLKVSFLKKIRDEQKFAGLDELKQQIGIDIEQAKDVFSFSE